MNLVYSAGYCKWLAAGIPRHWLGMGQYGLVHRSDEEIEVKFYGKTQEHWTKDGLKVTYEDYTSIIAEPYDLMISGYKSDAVNVLRLWKSKADAGLI